MTGKKISANPDHWKQFWMTGIGAMVQRMWCAAGPQTGLMLHISCSHSLLQMQKCWAKSSTQFDKQKKCDTTLAPWQLESDHHSKGENEYICNFFGLMMHIMCCPMSILKQGSIIKTKIYLKSHVSKNKKTKTKKLRGM